ncbi:MAG TPA: hypothetical protein VMY35_04575 [Phycisphaerae bacterium]|nr:hypothetical protein [Phycisphaerae bacterium]
MEVSEQQMAAAFDRWMLEYTEHPERFGHQWESIRKFLEARLGGEESSYGREATAYFMRLLRDGDAAFAGPGKSAAPPAASA